MDDRLEELQSTVQQLAGQLQSLEQRVRILEGAGSQALAPVRALDEPAVVSLPAIALPQGTVALVGRTLLVLAGAYVARALTDGRVVPPAVGVALGLAYAVFWQLRADREAGAGRRESAVFHSLASSLVAFPLIWETTARFGLLGPRAACAALFAFFVVGLGVAWRRRLAVGAGVTTGLALVTAVALLAATRDLAAVFGTLLAIAAALEWLAYKDRWLALRWWAALVLDGVAFLLAAVVSRPQGLPEGYVPLSPSLAAFAVLGLPALYVVSLAGRTLRRQHPVTFFEAAQGTFAILLGFGGAWKILAAHGGSALGPAGLALLLGALCYGAAFAFAERRVGQGRNFYFYATAGGLLTLGGVSAVAFGSALPFALAGLGLAAALLGRRFGRMTLRVHSALFVAAGAFETGLALHCARGLVGQAGELPSLAWVVALGAAASWAVLATDPRAPRGGWARTPQLILATLAVFALGKAAQLGIWTGLGERTSSDPGLAAVVRTAVLAGLTLGLALAARRGRWPELGWLVYPLVVLGGVKLLLQDLRHGRPETLVLSLALYGAVLVLAPRLMKVPDTSNA